MADFVDAPPATTPEPEKLPVIDFDFYFVGREAPLQITVWPSMGDTWNYIANDGYHFSFKRIGTEQDVWKLNMLTVSIKTGTRVPFSMDEFNRKMKEAADRKKKYGEEAR